MSKLSRTILTLALPGMLAVAYSVYAGDDDKAAAAKVDKNLGDDKKPVVEAKKEDKGGNWFTTFWTHRVGDTIGHGLKTGARKIDHAFTGGSKEKDEAEKRGGGKVESAPSAGPAPTTVTKPDNK